MSFSASITTPVSGRASHIDEEERSRSRARRSPVFLRVSRSVAPITDVRWHVPHDDSEAVQPSLHPRVQQTLRALLERK